ncbi:DnaA ATPase domain-containing protein [Spiroplasma turonicum]|uniref:Primosomal protein DnaI n=1 Tax=Spiroplasma turonicum TaxID=216946 RepID=A0A0K1P554_9MOLU|nr:DnaA/Hda family protein [Spiroplasma turonicum]AKU79413.1 primosomal protein DnaI [Spiroplasma turonicum]ALX70434.1 primosomal protein DnaI [Spiroplasma turonicum]
MDSDLLFKFKNDSQICKFINKFKISDEILIKNSNILETFLNEFTICKSNEPLSKCKQIMKGIQQKLSYKNKLFYITSENCNHWKYEHKYYNMDKNIIYCDYDKSEIRSTLQEFVANNDNYKMDPSLKNFLNEFAKVKNNKDFKGFYLYGNPGIGKTYILKLVANTHAMWNEKVIFVSVNKLIKSIKDSFNNNEDNFNNYFFDNCCDVEVLILDDIGGEMVSDWSRDEILFGLLNYRMEKKLKTYFSSNFSIIDLENNYINNKNKNNGQLIFDKVKTKRFTERIKALAYFINLRGENKRY